ncbi:MAG: hypothetical protein WBJ21_13315 [Burkholderiaceae bacterium]|jgi:hypothetical protein
MQEADLPLARRKKEALYCEKSAMNKSMDEKILRQCFQNSCAQNHLAMLHELFTTRSV